MQLKSANVAAVLTGLVASTAMVGCESSYPKPSEDAIYYFVANARVNGKMRVCWPAGQKYALAIAAADVRLQSMLDELRQLVSYGDEWPPDDPRWLDAKAVGAEVERLEKLARDGAKARKKALEDLHAAVNAKLPEGLTFADDQAREAFRKRLWSALDYEGEPLEDYIARSEKLLDQRLKLFQTAQEVLKTSAKSGDESKASDQDLHAEVHTLFGDWYSAVAAERERFLQYAETKMHEIRPEIAKLDKQKERERYNLLDNQRTYILTRVDGMRHELRELIRAGQKELEQLKSAANPEQQEIKLRERGEERLGAELSKLDQIHNALKSPTAQP